MKVFGVLLLTLCTTSLVFGHSSHRSSNTNSNNNDWDNDQQWQDEQRNMQQQQTNQGSSRPNSNDPLASEFTDLLPYRMKITQRIENSEALRDQTETKEKLMKFLENKANVCRTSSAGKNKVDRQCIGRLTGQMMQMITMFEEGNQQNMPLFNDW